MTSSFIHTSTLALALASAAFLSACDRNDARQDADASNRGTNQTADRSTSSAASGAVQSVSNAAADMTITASVKTRLATDSQLSAMAINVDTSAGRVALRGTAPDSGARTRATELVRSVDGVVDVDNQLTVQAAAQ